ncbi:MAG: hypothetical protein NTY09_11145 [bacterium]|nr:hypothetical protein [bacterium]
MKYIFYDELIDQTKLDRKPRFKIYTPDNTHIVLGFGSDLDNELNIDRIGQDRIDVYRRRGGGCAVVLDPGNVIVSVVLPSSGFGKINEYFKMISAWLIEGLRESGVEEVYREGVSDLVIQNRKIGGACMQRKCDFVYYSVSLLVNPQIDLMERYLKHPPREPEYRKGRAHSDFVGTIAESAGIHDTRELMEALIKNLHIAKLDIIAPVIHNGSQA